MFNILHPNAVKSIATKSVVANLDTAPTEKQEFKTFKAGEVYQTRSVCNHDCIMTWKVTKRTDKSVWLVKGHLQSGEFVAHADEKSPKRRKVEDSYHGDSELVYPDGKYSMCPVLTPEKIV